MARKKEKKKVKEKKPTKYEDLKMTTPEDTYHDFKKETEEEKEPVRVLKTVEDKDVLRVLKEKLEPLQPGQKYFEAPDGTIVIGEEDKQQLWYRKLNGGNGGWINPKR